MRNIKSNEKGSTDVKQANDRVFDSKTADFNDSNKDWDDFQLYYVEEGFQPSEKADMNTEAIERGKAFVRGRLILMAIQDELKHNVHTRGREARVA